MRLLSLIFAIALTVVCFVACDKGNVSDPGSNNASCTEESADGTGTDTLSGDTISDDEPSYDIPDYGKLSHFYHELDDYSYIIQAGDELTVNGTLFIFEKDVPEATRQSFVENQLKLNGELGIPEGCTFVLTSSYIDRYDGTNEACFVLASSIGSWRQILTSIQLSEGDDINYGYAYAMAQNMAMRLGWESDQIEDISEADVKTMLTDDPERLSLVYPCFISPYSTEEQIKLAKALAVRIYENLEGDVGEEGFLTAVSAYANEYNIPYHETYLKFADGGKSVPLIIRTLFVEEWITDDFETDSCNITAALPDHANWRKNISEMVRIRELSDSSIEHARRVLRFDGDEREIAIYFQYKEGDLFTGYFNHTYHNKLFVSSAWVICHEYVHYIHWDLTMNLKEVPRWCLETLACYFHIGMRHDIYSVNVATGAREGVPLNLEEYRQELRKEDAEWLQSLEISPSAELRSDDGWYGKYYSFGLYLSDVYGEYTFGQLMLYPEKTIDLVGKTIDELVADWEEYIRSVHY